ncbi:MULTISPECIES: lipoprotein [Providencia]|uniref:lipoprotein n=1 Tax=Providencia TaxID=586 RepID=UPI000837CC20|nr:MULTISPECIES: lipoprotein [Providencia]MBP6121227.1 lipoprotein [Providencia sp.]MDD9341450.1 lipoprotein [Providencia heimbachae]NIH22881.1 lipoprotein [Providencia heimbachae]QCJ70277.1 lipoprotein [Providencia heimbachae]
MKKFLLATIVGMLTLVAGCSQLTDFSISESQINQYLANKVKYEHNIGITGFADADIQLANLKSQIGRSEPGKVSLNGEATVKLDSLIGKADAKIELTLTARPIFDAKTGSIYLKELNISKYTVIPENMDTAMSAVIPYLNSSLETFFETQPVYVLNPDNGAAEATAKKLAKGLEIKPGKLVIPLID